MLPPGEKPLSDPYAGGPVVMPEDRPAAVQPPRKRSLLVRLLPLLIVVVALGGFGGIVGYYYLASSSGSVEGVAPLVRADQRPVRVRPENPGGMDVPHQDKEIYDKVAGRGAPPPAAERLLPPPETPLPRPAPPQAAAAPSPSGVLGAGPVAPGTLGTAPPRPPTAPPPPAASVPAPPDVTPPQDVASARTIPPPPPGSTALPGAAPRAVAPPPPVPPPGPPPAAPAAVPRAGSGSRVVLASVQSEPDARREWERLLRQYGDALSGLTPEFVRTDLGERGIFWRIYVGPVESGSEAQARCAALKQRQVNCFVARP